MLVVVYCVVPASLLSYGDRDDTIIFSLKTMYMKVTLTASLIVCHHSNGFRALKEIEGTNKTYYAGSQETKISVKIRKASPGLLKEELSALGVKIEDLPTIEMVAPKFSDELVTRPSGKIAKDQSTGVFMK